MFTLPSHQPSLALPHTWPVHAAVLGVQGVGGLGLHTPLSQVSVERHCPQTMLPPQPLSWVEMLGKQQGILIRRSKQTKAGGEV
jgi:hypothetical protein